MGRGLIGPICTEMDHEYFSLGGVIRSSTEKTLILLVELNGIEPSTS